MDDFLILIYKTVVFPMVLQDLIESLHFFWNLLNHHLNVLFFGNSLGYSIYRGPLFSSPKKKPTASAVSKAGLNSNWRIQLGAVQFTAQGRPDLERLQGLGVREKKHGHWHRWFTHEKWWCSMVFVIKKSQRVECLWVWPGLTIWHHP